LKRLFVWVLVIFNVLMVTSRLIGGSPGQVGGADSFTEYAGFIITTMAFSMLGALIVTRANGNRVGWLMLILGFVLADPFAIFCSSQVRSHNLNNRSECI
jgi:hypothetical protein